MLEGLKRFLGKNDQPDLKTEMNTPGAIPRRNPGAYIDSNPGAAPRPGKSRGKGMEGNYVYTKEQQGETRKELFKEELRAAFAGSERQDKLVDVAMDLATEDIGSMSKEDRAKLVEKLVPQAKAEDTFRQQQLETATKKAMEMAPANETIVEEATANEEKLA